jgi:GR25 family glycosyltransferase involved in LPS biosynthesis
MDTNLQIIVICCNEERKREMTCQFKYLKLPYPVHYFNGYTPEASREYMNDADPINPENEGTFCCMRSHAGALHHFVTAFPEKIMCLILEDDVALSLNFDAEMRKAIAIWNIHHDDVDFVSLGYIPMSEKHRYLKADRVLRWGFDCTYGTVWGTQAYLIKRSTALSMVHILHQPTSKALRESFDAHLTNTLHSKPCSNKVTRLQSDVLLSVGWRQGYVYPPLAIEYPSISKIENGNVYPYRGWEAFIIKSERAMTDYYDTSLGIELATTHITKRLILSADTAFPFGDSETVQSHCVANTKLYAESRGIDFQFVPLTGKEHDRHPSWSKLLVLAKFIKNYDEILWVNSDTTLVDTKTDIDLLTLLETSSNPSFLLHTIAKVTNGSVEPDSSMFLLNCKDKGKALSLLNDWYVDIPEKRYETEAPYEQSVFSAWAKNPAKNARVRVLDVRATVQPDEKAIVFRAGPEYLNARISLAKRVTFRRTNPQPKRVGIIVRQQNYYTNGCGQNCIFMMQSLEALGHTVDLLVTRIDKDKPLIVSESLPFSYIELSAINYSDYSAIIYGAQMPGGTEVAAMKAAGVRRIVFSPCNVFDAFHNESFLYACKTATMPFMEMSFKDIGEEVWITDNHKETTQTYLEVINKNKMPIHVVPLVWSQLFLLNKEGGLSKMKHHTGKALDIVIMEPNLGYCKSAWLPLIICEKLFLESPELIHNVYLFCTPDTNKTALQMIQSLEIHKSKVLRTMSRIPITDILAHFSDPGKHGDHTPVFLSNQINLPLNYAYYDILSAGFPFVHNSPKLKEKGLGCYYDVLAEGAEQIRRIPTSFNSLEATSVANRVLASQEPYSEECLSVFQTILRSSSSPSSPEAGPTLKITE